MFYMTKKLRLVDTPAPPDSVEQRRRQIRQLQEIRNVLRARSLGVLPPRPGLALGATVVTLVAVFAASYRLSLSSLPTIVFAVSLTGIISATIMRCSSRPRTHAAHLDELLANYSPTSKEAYRYLQAEVRKAGYFDRDLIEMWICEERAAIDGSADSPVRPSCGFLDKQV